MSLLRCVAVAGAQIRGALCNTQLVLYCLGRKISTMTAINGDKKPADWQLPVELSHSSGLCCPGKIGSSNSRPRPLCIIQPKEPAPPPVVGKDAVSSHPPSSTHQGAQVGTPLPCPPPPRAALGPGVQPTPEPALIRARRCGPRCPGTPPLGGSRPRGAAHSSASTQQGAQTPQPYLSFNPWQQSVIPCVRCYPSGGTGQPW